MRGKLIVLDFDGAQMIEASMRPAHYAREVPVIAVLRQLRHKRFNEARALCAGSSGCGRWAGSMTNRFNEARALCAGSSPKKGRRLRCAAQLQ